ncbi:MAG: RNA polymerase sigma-70 factor [Chitinophagaceae bacterium]|nr:RNA polymerase sigma-70 factor [Chitinophagaceae bacterium]
MNGPSLTTAQLFQQISAGDESAFTLLFHRYADKIYSYSIKIVHTKFWAEEAVQNLFTQVWQHREKLVAVEQPEAYLFRMATNRCIDILRANEKAIRVYHLKQIEYTCASDELLNYKESEAILQQAIRLLPEKRKIIYQLRTSGGLSYDEISEQLKVSPHTVRNQLAKAIQTIRAFLLANRVSPVIIAILLAL